jgi:hypothetical protein
MQNARLHSLSWPATAGHPGDEGLLWRVDTRLLDGPVKPGYDKFGMKAA